jgi:hypothetical protein
MEIEELKKLLNHYNPEYELTNKDYAFYLGWINTDDYIFDLVKYGTEDAIYRFFFINNLKLHRHTVTQVR